MVTTTDHADHTDHADRAEDAPARGAAFFDLDRTLLSGASGPAISAGLRAVGLMSERSIPGQDLVFGIFNVFGETLPSMLLTRQAASMAARWPRAAAQEAGRRAAETLIDLVQPYARVLIDEHRAAGRPVVIATTTPYDLVRPLADLMGVDAVIATRYGEHDGVYTGRIEGEFVWSHGKYRAVKEWADEHDVSLAESYAYSDSYYDVPLLNAVGHPVVVNPDRDLARVAIEREWEVRRFVRPVRLRDRMPVPTTAPTIAASSAAAAFGTGVVLYL
ncbi:MAG: HAD family hydrolase, partial [Acidimicrobiales bacterium]